METRVLEEWVVPHPTKEESSSLLLWWWYGVEERLLPVVDPRMRM